MQVAQRFACGEESRNVLFLDHGQGISNSMHFTVFLVDEAKKTKQDYEFALPFHGRE